MSRLLATSRRLAFAVAALALTAGLTASARAEVAYAFATETITGLRGSVNADTGVTLTIPLSNVTTTTNSSASLNGDGISHNNATDALQSYIGTPPPPPQNFFAKYATFVGASPALNELPSGLHVPISGTGLPGNPYVYGPTTPLTGSFTRGDVQLLGIPNTLSSVGRVVAESYLNGGGQSEIGHGGNQVSAVFTLTGATGLTAPVTINYSYINDLYAVVQNTLNPGGDKAQANVAFGLTVTDAAGNIVFDLSRAPANEAGQVTLGINAPPNGLETIKFGDQTVTTGALALGTYKLNITLDATTSVTTAAVPEPATMAMALTALPLLGFGLLRRRARNRAVRA